MINKGKLFGSSGEFSITRVFPFQGWKFSPVLYSLILLPIKAVVPAHMKPWEKVLGLTFERQEYSFSWNSKYSLVQFMEAEVTGFLQRLCLHHNFYVSISFPWAPCKKKEVLWSHAGRDNCWYS